MSRKKNFTVKLVAGASFEEKRDAATYGDTRTVETMQIVEGWANHVAFFDGGGWDRLASVGVEGKALASKNRKRNRALILDHLAEEMIKACNTGDGSFFKKLAADFEAHKKPACAVRAWLQDHRDRGPLLEVKRLHIFVQTYLQRNFDLAWFAKVVKEVGFPTKPDRIGRPKKNSGN